MHLCRGPSMVRIVCSSSQGQRPVQKAMPAAYVYCGPGAGYRSALSAVQSLRAALVDTVRVERLTTDQLLASKWQGGCLLLVMPGGADLPYCRHLNGTGNTLIREYVQGGGSYLGLCAGAYYACARVEFEPGTRLEVVGDRELSFFPGVARGSIYKGFNYESENGAAAVPLWYLNLLESDPQRSSPDLLDEPLGFQQQGKVTAEMVVVNDEVCPQSGIVVGDTAAVASVAVHTGFPVFSEAVLSRPVTSCEAHGNGLAHLAPFPAQLQRQQQQQEGINGIMQGIDTCQRGLQVQEHEKFPCSPRQQQDEDGAEGRCSQEGRQESSQLWAQCEDYINGGPGFFSFDQSSLLDHPPPGVQVLATYPERDNAAAALLCVLGNGRAVLCGTHPELEPAWLEPCLSGAGSMAICSDRASRESNQNSCTSQDSGSIVDSGADVVLGGTGADAGASWAVLKGIQSEVADVNPCISSSTAVAPGITAGDQCQQEASSLSETAPGLKSLRQVHARLVAKQEERWQYWQGLLVAAGLAGWLRREQE